ncbi:MAG: FtsW/RodA/SpoVE family cell cycle protein [Crocinitomicaceae bacterium]|jgi:cell division protein FtsW|nr:FtsW/RodA/SpoVE family cell cycle protein [Crocinitomicaceae bacterium]MCF8410731.1 FtsW/RodA/SpoVE family cell cycle protein [Crocinitomicaceae bacterium]
MKSYLKYLKGDPVIWVVSLILLSFSLVTVYSFVPILVKMEGGSPLQYLYKHFVYVLIGFFAMYWIHLRDPKYFSQLAKLGFYLAVGLLIYTLLFGSKINDAGRWIRIPFIGLTFQSSDFAKVAIVVYLSRLLIKYQDDLNDWRSGVFHVFWPPALICILIVKDNFSTAALLFMICIIILFIGKMPVKKLLIIISGIVLLGIMTVGIHKAAPAINILPRYQTWENRIFNKLEDDKDILSNAQALNARLAINNGSFLGQGVGDGKLKEYIPEAYADFYYASFVEEFGSLSAIFLVLLYLILLFRIIRVGLNAEKLFETYVCLGIGILLLTQVSINMLVCTGVFPVTGQNMPLLAMGGSALIMACVSIGIVQSIAHNQQKKSKSKTDHSFDAL